MSNNDMNSKDFLLGVVVGGIIGAATALLLAPKPGNELRGDIKETWHTVSHKTQELAHQIGERGQEIAKTVGAQTSELLHKAKEVASAVADEVKNLRGSQSALSEASEAGADSEEAK